MLAEPPLFVLLQLSCQYSSNVRTLKHVITFMPISGFRKSFLFLQNYQHAKLGNKKVKSEFLSPCDPFPKAERENAESGEVES